MDGLTQSRVTSLSDWRNAAWKARNSASENSLDIKLVDGSAGSARPDRLTSAVATQVIPKLLGAHPARSQESKSVSKAYFDEADVMEFTCLVASRDVADARRRIELERGQGTALESVFLNLLIPAARRLSDLWETDHCHYEEIAVGMLNLQQLLHDLSPAFSNEKPRRISERRALLMSAPGERNMLGVFMVTEFYRCVAAEFFYRDGWDVWPTPPMSLRQLLGIVSSQWFDLIEVSATCGARVPLLAADIAQLKAASRNPQIGLLISGPAFDNHPELVDLVGADGCGRDPREVMIEADAFIDRRDRGR